ncbi:hypothetical protein [Paraglaciecola sp. 25GB23A]|uniref:hypothetical protein n=1 Tax=Paraglaciecola sp. 25GB23A TaxID=3156068 RepID=UPI0032AF474C
MTRWKDKTNPQVILEELNSRFSVDEKGQISSKSIQAGNIFGVIADMFNFNKQVPEYLKKRLLRTAFDKIKKDGNVNLSNLQKHISIEEQSYIIKPIEKFHLVTSISIGQDVKFPVINIDGVRISISPLLPKKYTSARKKIIKTITGSEFDVGGLNNQFVVVTTFGKTINEAVDSALDKLDLIRAIWNFFFNLNQTWRISFDQHKSVNKTKLGQYHSIHNSNGSLASETWWYEPSFSQSNSGHISENTYEIALKSFLSTLVKFKKLKYKSELEKYLINYVRALDSDDLHSSFLKLWVVLEQITGTTFKDKKIGRAARIYSNFGFSLEIINYLRNFRDKAVHHNSSSQDIETILYHLKSIVEDHLSRLLGNKYNFESVNDFREFWDLPMSLDQIEKNQKEHKTKIKRLEQIKKFRRFI